MKLPDPVAWVYTDRKGWKQASFAGPHDDVNCDPLYTADQLREVRRAALEEAADIADTFASVEGIAQAISSIIRAHKENDNE